MLREEELMIIVDCWFADHEGDNIVLVNETEDKFIFLDEVVYEWEMSEDLIIHIENLDLVVNEIEEIGFDSLVIGDWMLDIM